MTTSRNKIARNAIVYIFGDGILKISTLALIPVLTQALTPDDYGVYSLSEVVRLLIVSVSVNVVTQVALVTQNDFSNDQDRREYLGSLWLAIFTIALILGSTIEFIGPALFDALFVGLPYDNIGRLTVYTGLLLMVEQSVALSILKIQQKAFKFVLYSVIPTWLRIAFVLYAVKFLDMGLEGALYAHLFAVLLSLFPYIRILRKELSFVFSFVHIRRSALLSLPLIVHQLGSWGLNMVDRAILSHYVSLAELGIYSLAYQIGMLVGMVSNSIGSAWMPTFFKHFDDEASHRKINSLTTYVICVSILIGFFLIAVDKTLVMLLTPEAYWGAAVFIPWIATSYVFLGIGAVPRTILLAKNKGAIIASATVCAVVIKVILTYAFASSHGAMGAAISTFVGFSVALVIVWVVALSASPLRSDLKKIAKLLGAGLVALYTVNFVECDIKVLELSLKIVSFVAVVSGILLVTRFFNLTELQSMKRFLFRK